MGELAPVVAQAARDGDAVALGLVDDIADELAAFATASIRRLSLEEEPVPVTLAGGLARGAADLLVPRVTELVRAVAPAAHVGVLHAPPVLGAALLGLDRLAPGDHAAADPLRARDRRPGTRSRARPRWVEWGRPGRSMSAVETAFTRLLGIDHPIIQAPIGALTNPRLAAAVSNAGGLGMLPSAPPSATSSVGRCARRSA